MHAERDRTVAIIGGLGRMGPPIERMFKEAGYCTLISDPLKDPKTLSVTEAIRRSEIIFFSVFPMVRIEEIIRSTIDNFDEAHRVLDNASLKNPLREGYKMLDGKRVSICSTHPLCKEDQPLFGQNVLIAPFGQKPQGATLIAEEVHQKAGMVLLRVDFDQHDALVMLNAFPHFVNRAVEIVLAQHRIDPGLLEKIASANLRLSNFAWWRTWIQPPEISQMLIEALLEQPEGRRLVEDLQSAMAQIIQESESPGSLERTFATALSVLDPTGEVKTVMNEETIVMLEHEANLRLNSIIVETEAEDQSGLAWTMLGVIKDAGINLNSIRSHVTKRGTIFHLGIKSGDVTSEVINKLEELGFHVISLTDS